MNSTLQWRHNGCDGVSSHRCLDRVINRLFRRRAKKTSKLRVTGLSEEDSPVTSEFPAKRASNAENIPSLWRHHVKKTVFISSNITYDFWSIPEVTHSFSWYTTYHVPLTRYAKLHVAHAPRMPGTFSPPPRASDPDMHRDTCRDR